MIQVDQLTEYEPLYEATFFKELARFKIEHWKLDDTPKPLYGVYQSTKFDSEIPRLNFSNVSLTQPKRLQSGPYDSVLKGVLYLFNTKETYEAADLADIYAQLRTNNQKKLDEFQSKEKFDFREYEREGPDHFVLFMFADLKGYIFKTKFVMLTAE